MVLLRVEGEVEAPRSFGFAELAALPGQVEAGTTSEVNACANVKSLGTIRLTIGPGEDTRLSR